MEAHKFHNDFSLTSATGFDAERYKMEKIMENFEALDQNK
jgi:hypothetical protein|tara:strand:+ start:863 stop:982 length:120 start_codon:yes stop_codon:yes gene_type:complete